MILPLITISKINIRCCIFTRLFRQQFKAIVISLMVFDHLERDGYLKCNHIYLAQRDRDRNNHFFEDIIDSTQKKPVCTTLFLAEKKEYIFGARNRVVLFAFFQEKIVFYFFFRFVIRIYSIDRVIVTKYIMMICLVRLPLFFSCLEECFHQVLPFSGKLYVVVNSQVIKHVCRSSNWFDKWTLIVDWLNMVFFLYIYKKHLPSTCRSFFFFETQDYLINSFYLHLQERVQKGKQPYLFLRLSDQTLPLSFFFHEYFSSGMFLFLEMG